MDQELLAGVILASTVIGGMVICFTLYYVYKFTQNNAERSELLSGE